MHNVVVLVTGQCSRLEMSSKITHLIRPLTESCRVHVHVVLSLSDGHAYTNPHKYTKGCPTSDVINQLETTLASIPYTMNKIKYPELTVNNDIVQMLDKQHFGKRFIANRARNHVRQYFTLAQSKSIVQQLNPDILIRIRDDAAFTSQPNWSSILSLIAPSSDTIITNKREQYGGINDHMAIVSKSAIDAYLCLPLESYYLYKHSKASHSRPRPAIQEPAIQDQGQPFKTKASHSRLHNPEQFLMYVYKKHNINLDYANLKICITKIYS